MPSKISIPKHKRVWSSLFKHKLKPYLIEEKYRVVPAFSIGGTDYWYFDNTQEVPMGRMMAALDIYREMECVTDKKYLEQHTAAMDKILSNPKKIDLQAIMQMNIFLKERIKLAPTQDFIYKLASVIFFDKTEAIYSYDFEYNEKKIERWKQSGGTLDFFLNTPLTRLVPSLTLPENDIQTYMAVAKLVTETHQQLLTNILSDAP